MLTVTVAQDGSGDFASIAEAVLAVPYEEEALVQVGPGIYREKLVCEKRCITLRGAGADKTKRRAKTATAAGCPTRTGGPPIPSAATPPFSAAKRSAWRR